MNAVRKLRAVGLLPAAALAVVLAVALLACSDENDLASPAPPARGGLAGQIRSLGAGLPADLTIESVDRAVYFVQQTATDSLGNFTIPLARGAYVLRVYPGDEGGFHGCGFMYARPPGLSHGRPDTLHVRENGTMLRTDVDFGALTARIALPPELRGERISLALRTWDGNGVSLPCNSSVTVTAGDSLVATLPGVAAGSYRLGVSGGPLAGTVYLPGTREVALADSVRIEEGRTALYTAAFAIPPPQRMGTLRGTVIGTWAQPGFWGLSIRACDASGEEAAWAEFEEADRYVFRLLAPAEYRLRIHSYQVDSWIGGESLEAATRFFVQPDSETVVPPIEEGGLRIRYEDEGLGPHDLWFDVFDAATGRLYHSWSDGTPGDWTRINGLPPGHWRLRVRPYRPGQACWLEQWYDRAASPEAAGTFTTSAGEVTDLTLRLEAGGVIRGRANGGGDWYSVFVTPAHHDTCWGSSTGYGEDGAFAIRGLPDGAYKLAVGRRIEPCTIPLPAGTAWYGDTADWDSAAVITIENHATIEGIEIRLPD